MDRPRRARLDPVQGQPPDLSRLDGGCSFRPRCGFTGPRCAREKPAIEPIDGGGQVACFEARAVATSFELAS